MKRLWMIAAVLSALALGSASAQMMGPGGGYAGPGGYGGYGGYGGMMGGGYGRMGPYPWQGDHQLTLSETMHLIEQGTAAAHVEKAKKEVVFTGSRISLVMAAVQPGFPDTTFEVAGLVNPTIVVPSGSLITLTLVNMDYGTDMDHGVVITPIGPPYPVMGMMGMPYSLTGVSVLAPRDLKNADEARFPEASVTFRAGEAGTYYYLCQYYDHASKGMYGKLVVVGG
jgi:rusticyanin